MFFLVVISDSIRIPPEGFTTALAAVTYEIEGKYTNQVLSSVGLVIKLHDILEVGEGVVLPGDGAAIVPVKARLVVFKPFIGEVIVGRIVLANEGGIRVTMQFFEHIWIAANQLPPGSEFSEAEGQWKWNYDNHSLWMEVGAQIRLKVSSVLFNKPTTSKKKKITPEEQIELPTTPMAIFATLLGNDGGIQPGLGMTTWWGEGATNGDAETHEEVPIQEERLGGDEDTIMAFEQQELMDGDNKDDKEENDSEGEKSYD